MSISDSTIVILAIVLIATTIIGNMILMSLYAPKPALETISGRATQGQISLVIIQAQFSLGIPLYTGMNWFSVAGIPLNTTLQYMTTSIGAGTGTQHEIWPGSPGCTGNAADNYVGNYTVIWTYNTTDIADPWKDFNPTKPCHQLPTQEIQTLKRQNNYQITMSVDDYFILDVAKITPTTIPVYAGMNWIGYPTNVPRNATLSFDTIGAGAGTQHEIWVGSPGCTGNAADNYVGNYTVIWTYNATDVADPWKDYNPTKPCHQLPTQEIQYLKPGQGYQLTMIENDTWVISW